MKTFSSLILLLTSQIRLGAADPLPVVRGRNEHRLIVVPAGKYAIGADSSRRNPTRKTELGSFTIADAETTNAQFANFVAATGFVTDAEKTGYGMVALEGMADWAWDPIEGAHWRKPRGNRGPGWESIKNHPVTQISGADAEAYCKWLGARLPRLEEWEVAARARASTLYPWGDTMDPGKANTWNGSSHLKNSRDDGYIYTAPVKSFPPNRWGLYDVIGNVFEYCSGMPADAGPGAEESMVTGRGGSWWCSTSTCRSFNLVDIGCMSRHGTLSNQGFRVVLDDIPR